MVLDGYVRHVWFYFRGTYAFFSKIKHKIKNLNLNFSKQIAYLLEIKACDT